MPAQHILDLDGGDLDAAELDQVVQPSLVEKAPIHDPRKVSGAHPSAIVGSFRELRLAPVSGERCRPAKPELAAMSSGTES